MPKVSIIIRGKNEEDWLGITLRGIKEQDFKNYEIIYVDNISEDSSVEIAKEEGVKKIVSIKKYLPGLAINKGIEVSEGELICILSAHCVPFDKKWLSNLVKSIDDNKDLAGVYGRQCPLPFSYPDDARDLFITFGEEDIVQKKDPFFHNANSIIRKEILKKIPINSKISNIEDREWAKRVLDKGYKLKYSSDSKVFHFHGLHQHGKKSSFRAESVSNLIKDISNTNKYSLPSWFDLKNRECPIIFYGINQNLPKKIKNYISLNKGITEQMFYFADKKIKLDKEIIFIKRKISNDAPFSEFLNEILDNVNEKIGFKPEALCFVDLSYNHFIKNSYKTNKEIVFLKNYPFSSFAYEDKGDVWYKNGDDLKPIKQMFDHEGSFYRITFGQATVMRTSFIKQYDKSRDGGFLNSFNDLKYMIRNK